MAANKTKFILLVFFLFSTLLTAKANREEPSNPTEYGKSEVNVSGIANALEENGYEAAALNLKTTLRSLIGNQNSSFTIFCPTDVAYALLKYVQPPPTLVAYHVTPFYIQREDLELRGSALRMYSAIDTLLPGHPLVVTTQVPHSNSDSDSEAEVNMVKIIDWNIYDDGQIIVHGIQDFFDPAIQSILFPWVEHHGIFRPTTKSQEKGYFRIANNPLDFLAMLVLCALAISGLVFWAYLSSYGAHEVSQYYGINV